MRVLRYSHIWNWEYAFHCWGTLKDRIVDLDMPEKKQKDILCQEKRYCTRSILWIHWIYKERKSREYGCLHRHCSVAIEKSRMFRVMLISDFESDDTVEVSGRVFLNVFPRETVKLLYAISLRSPHLMVYRWITDLWISRSNDPATCSNPLQHNPGMNCQLLGLLIVS